MIWMRVCSCGDGDDDGDESDDDGDWGDGTQEVSHSHVLLLVPSLPFPLTTTRPFTDRLSQIYRACPVQLPTCLSIVAVSRFYRTSPVLTSNVLTANWPLRTDQSLQRRTEGSLPPYTRICISGDTISGVSQITVCHSVTNCSVQAAQYSFEAWTMNNKAKLALLNSRGSYSKCRGALVFFIFLFSDILLSQGISEDDRCQVIASWTPFPHPWMSF